MRWIDPPEKDKATDSLEARPWSAANHLWAGAGLKQSDCSEPIPFVFSLWHSSSFGRVHRLLRYPIWNDSLITLATERETIRVLGCWSATQNKGRCSNMQP